MEAPNSSSDNAPDASKHKPRDPSSSDTPPPAPSPVNLPPTTIVDANVDAVIRHTLGPSTASLYSLATRLVAAHDPSGASLQTATSHFVTALQAVDEAHTESAAFAELLLGYGKALLGFVVRNGAAAAVLGGDVEAEVKKGKAAGADRPPAVATEEEEEVDVEEEDDEELAWTQLELARVIFEKLANQHRLAEVHAVLGELLLEGDQALAAGVEFGKAAELGEGRCKAEWLYKRYLALRRDDPLEALKAIRESETVFQQFAHDDDVLKEIREEAQGFESAIKPVKEEKEGEGEIKVVTVRPRKRARMNDS